MEYLTEEDYQIAEQNGIPKNVVDRRYYYSYTQWTKEDAITKPLKSPPKYEEEWNDMKEIALVNGITRSHFGVRMRRGKSKEEAAGPRLTPDEIAQCYKKRNNRKNPYVSRALENGIKPYTYYRRLVLGWTEEEACTEPVGGQARASHY